MSLHGRKSSSSNLVRKRSQTGEETNTAENQGTTHSVGIFVPRHFENQANALNRFPPTTFILPTTTSGTNELVLVYEIQVTGEIIMSQE